MKPIPRLLALAVALALPLPLVRPVQAQTPTATPAEEFPGADLVSLLDETTVKVDADGSFTATRHVRSKVLTQRGRRAAETVVPLNSRYQTWEFRYARATLADGSVREVKPSDIATEAVFPGQPAYHEIRGIRYRIPGVEVGATLDQEYVLRCRPIMDRHFWMIWRPRSLQPVLDCRLQVQTPADMTLRWKAHHAELQPEATTAGDVPVKTYRWEFRAPSLVPSEPYMPAADEFLPWVELSTVDSWATIGRWLGERCSPSMDSSEELHNRVRSLVSQPTPGADKLAAIYRWVQDNVQHVPVDLALSGFLPRPSSQTLQTRYGDGKDLAVLLGAMLREAGIPARLAFLEAGTARPLDDRLPMPRHLNHCIVIAEADGQTFYLDPTSETARPDVVLARLCNTELLIADEQSTGLIPGPRYDGSRHGTRETIRGTLEADGTLRGSIEREYLGEADAMIRAAFKYVNADQLRTLLERELARTIPRSRLLDHEVGDITDRSTTFRTRYRIEAPGWAKQEGNQLSFECQLPQQTELNDTLFRKPERVHPFVFHESAPARVRMEITLPYGYTIASLPREVRFDNEFSRWTRTVRHEDNRVVIEEHSHLKNARLPPAALGEVRRYYEEAIARKADRVVLLKP